MTVHYPFHPLHNRRLDVVIWPRQPHNAVTVKHPDGQSLKIPLWMLQPDAADFRLREQVELPASILLALVDMLPACAKVAASNPLKVPWVGPVAMAKVSVCVSSGSPSSPVRVIGRAVSSAVLTLCEVSIVVALATVFSAFSSPFLTAVFTFGVFVVGRSADTLAHLPQRVFGSAIKSTGEVLSRVVPNLMVYVPPRPLLTGEAADTPLGPYVAMGALQALAWSVGLLAVASLIFRRRDFL